MVPTTFIEPILVGREKELDFLQRHLDKACQGSGSVVFISGEAGAGKTRLVNEFLSSLKQRELTVLSGFCLSNVTDPYFPFIGAFREYNKSKKPSRVQSFEPSQLEKLLMSGPLQIEEIAWSLAGYLDQGVSGGLGGLDPQVWKDITYSIIAKGLRSISETGVMVIFLEDLQWADSASLSLLHYIAGLASSQRILILATFRNDELTADAEGHPHFLVDILRALERDGLSEEIHLQGLSAM